MVFCLSFYPIEPIIAFLTYPDAVGLIFVRLVKLFSPISINRPESLSKPQLPYP